MEPTAAPETSSQQTGPGAGRSGHARSLVARKGAAVAVGVLLASLAAGAPAALAAGGSKSTGPAPQPAPSSRAAAGSTAAPRPDPAPGAATETRSASKPTSDPAPGSQSTRSSDAQPQGSPPSSGTPVASGDSAPALRPAVIRRAAPAQGGTLAAAVPQHHAVRPRPSSRVRTRNSARPTSVARDPSPAGVTRTEAGRRQLLGVSGGAAADSATERRDGLLLLIGAVALGVLVLASSVLLRRLRRLHGEWYEGSA
jgi:hypothetical protein